MAITPGKPVTPSSIYRPICCLVQQTSQTGWTSNTPTPITFTSEVVDSDSLHDVGSNTSRINIGAKLGWWEVSGVYCTASNSATTLYRAVLYLNGSPIVGSFGGIVLPGSGSSGFCAIPTARMLVQATASGDYVELYGIQVAASGTIGTGVATPFSASSLTAAFLRDA